MKENKDKLNILYLNCHNQATNFYESIRYCGLWNVVYRYEIENLSIESYDAFIVSINIFSYNENEAKSILEKMIISKKPVIIVYSSDYSPNYKGLIYLKERFEIDFEEKDAAIIEDTYYGYFPDTNNGFALSMISKKNIGKLYIKNTNNCFILKFDNVSIIHDIKWVSSKKEIEMLNQKSELLQHLLNEEKNDNKPDWVEDIKILDDQKISNEISKITERIEIYNQKKNELENKIRNNNEYKKVLYTSGEELVTITKKILMEMLGISIRDLDVKKEDLSFVLDEKKILVEIKGVNTSIKREHVSQIQRHIEDEAKINNVDDDVIPCKYKGLLIVNPYIKSSLQERRKKEFYSKSVIGDIMHYDICAIDTITLLGMFQKYKTGEKIDFKKIILNENYIEPDFSIMQEK